ncbi:MAG: GNAT family N-acetyltransferase [Kurthia sp.]|nr:GNAT family N-acetyltransferase [Candidatus Kurthia equi]
MNWRALIHFQLPTMTQVWNDSFEDYVIPIELTEDELQQRITYLNLSDKASFIAEVGDQQAGIVLYGEELFQGHQTAWIGGMGVIKPFRQHGVGKAMVQKTIEMAKQDGISTLHLEVIVGNVEAEKLYHSSGFVEVNRTTVGQVEMTNAFKNTINLQLEDAVITSKHQQLESTNTIWQNRLNRKNQLKRVTVDAKEIGYFYWNEDKKQLHQLQLINYDTAIFDGILSKLYELYGEFSFSISNLDIEHPLINFLKVHGYQEKLQQRHMCMEFKV